MTDKRAKRSTTKLPPMMSMRDFLRGGYQQIDEPTVLLSHSNVFGTFIPGKIDSAYRWVPGDAPRSSSAPLPVSSQDPAWLAPAARRTRRKEK